MSADGGEMQKDLGAFAQSWRAAAKDAWNELKRRVCSTKWKRAWTTPLAALLAVIAALSLGAGLAAYFFIFDGRISRNSQEWSNFGSYLAGVCGLAVGFASLSAVLFASVIVPETIESSRKLEQQGRTAAEMSKLFYSRDYYLNVIVPVWEVACKWLSWKGAEGDRYKRDVAGGQFMFKHVDFRTAEEAAAVPFQNRISLRGHFDDISSATIPNEHMILSMWLRFWIDLEAAVVAKSISEEAAISKFRGFYGWTRDFVQQLRIVGKLLAEGEHTDVTVKEFSEPLERLERLFYGDELFFVQANEDEARKVKALLVPPLVKDNRMRPPDSP